jgi:hypothetical protein
VVYPLARGSPEGLPRRAARGLKLVCEHVEGSENLPIVKLRDDA